MESDGLTDLQRKELLETNPKAMRLCDVFRSGPRCVSMNAITELDGARFDLGDGQEVRGEIVDNKLHLTFVVDDDSGRSLLNFYDRTLNGNRPKAGPTRLSVEPMPIAH